MNKFLLPLIVAAFVASPAIAQDSPQALLDDFAASIVAEDADAVAALYTDDAFSYDPGGSVSQGPDAIAANWGVFFDGFDGFSITFDQQGEMHEGDVAAAWGLWTMSATPVGGGELVVWKGRFTDVSKKTRDGWRYLADHASMLVTQAAPEAHE